ncbi:uncharacterized protein EAE97_008675 [Botrytis byssoidea]|uniref:Aminoglycoside phosphotransferase domain-containing protein n=1 Tax=Botrytis byssoidea TaxID=139641 RepID=A0A9P5I8A7_9HELO|nr:uncharacterized protein EAE97_008675 [Botrytis byssoidea]KAF7934315.1 hypothetical protein EAE97_008675 [Botrytis byssoidea]
MAEFQDAVAKLVQESLAATPYACKSLIPLSGGSSNYVYHGTLMETLPDGTIVVIIKHTEPHLFSNKNYKLTTTRTFYESQILKYLTAFPAQSVSYNNITISTPKLLHYDASTNTQVHTHHPSPNCTNLKSYILKYHTAITPSTASVIGYSLGNWLKKFHSWANSPAQSEVREVMEGNHTMRTLKLAINYTNLVTMIDSFPNILGGSRIVFENVEKEMLAWINGGTEGTRELIHGDFWCGNVLLPDTLLYPSTPAAIFITDHELSHLSTPIFDLAQMCAELYMLTFFKSIPAGKELLIAFIKGYGLIEEDKRWRMLIYIGCHLICWGSRTAGWGSMEQVEACVELGRDLVVNGWERNREWCTREGWAFLTED